MVNTMRNDLKLVDFGFACDAEKCKELSGSLMYASPEILNILMTTKTRNIELTREQVIQHDLWALGMTIYVCLTGRFPIDFYSLQTDIKSLYEFYSQQSLVPAVEYFGPLKIQMVKSSISFQSELEIEKTRHMFLSTLPLEVRYRVDYKQYLRPEPRKIVKTLVEIEQLQEEDNDRQLELKAKNLERRTKNMYNKLFRKRQQDYGKKTLDEFGVIRRLWRYNPTWEQFITTECQIVKVSTADQLFRVLIQSKSKWDRFWQRMLTATRARRQTLPASIIRKSLRMPDSQANYRGGNVLEAKQALDGLIQM
jgi:serine/threonine protein kinase